jgi:hypothetical protein
MPDEPNTSTPDGNEPSGVTSAAGDEFKPITSQEELNAALKPRLERERSKFADYKDLKAKADKFDELDAASKSELEKANDRATAAEAEAATIPAKVAEALRGHLVSLGVVDKDDEVLLTASDPDALLAQVKRLSDRAADRKKNGNVVPKEGSTPTTAPDDERAAVRELFGAN